VCTGECVATDVVAAVKGQIIGRELIDGWVKYRIAIDTIFKREVDAYGVTRGEMSLWQSEQDFLCKCPKLRLGRHYLLLGKPARSEQTTRTFLLFTGKASNYEHPVRAGLQIDNMSAMFDWADTWYEKLRKFVYRQRHGKCAAIKRRRDEKLVRTTPSPDERDQFDGEEEDEDAETDMLRDNDV
jgi:netrin receptor unc-5